MKFSLFKRLSFNHLLVVMYMVIPSSSDETIVRDKLDGSYFSRIAYQKLVIIQEAIETDLDCSYRNSSENVTVHLGNGRKHSITFEDPSNLSFAVYDTYSEASDYISIEFNSSWDKVSGSMNDSYIMHLFNVSYFESTVFETFKRQLQKVNCSSNDAYIEIDPGDTYWCRKGITYNEYTGLDAVMKDNGCYVLLRNMEAHYLYLWKKSTAHIGRARTCFDRYIPRYEYYKFLRSEYLQDEFGHFYSCQRNQRNGNCNFYNLKFYSAIASGKLRKAIMTRDLDGVYHISLVLDLETWTQDYPDVFFKSVNACLTELGSNGIEPTLKFDIFHEDEIVVPPPSGAPFHFWLFAIIMISPGFILIVAIIILTCTRSSRGLQIDIWNWSKIKKKLKSNDTYLTDEEFQRRKKLKSSNLVSTENEVFGNKAFDENDELTDTTRFNPSPPLTDSTQMSTDELDTDSFKTPSYYNQSWPNENGSALYPIKPEMNKKNSMNYNAFWGSDHRESINDPYGSDQMRTSSFEY